MKSMIRFILVLAAGALAALPAAGQFEQYTPSGRFEERRESTEDLLEHSMSKARWRVGRVYAEPWIGLRDVAWVSDVNAGTDLPEQSDVTATVGAGVRAYVPLGEMIVALHALPEYVYWQEREERRRVNGRYGVGLFGNLGRIGVEAAATRSDDATFVSREVERRVNTRDDRLHLDAEVELGGSFALFAGAGQRNVRFLTDPEEGDTFTALERDETLLRAGLRLQLSPSLTIGVGAERSEVDFLVGALRSNEGTSPLFQLELDRTPLRFDVDLAWRDLVPAEGTASAFVPYEGLTGSARLVWRSSARFEVQTSADRNLVYSTSDDWAYFEETIVGTGVRFGLSSRLALRLYAESGTHDYALFAGADAPRRADDFETGGVDLLFRLGRLQFLLGAAETRYDSNVDDFDRSLTVIRSSLRIGTGASTPWG